MIFLFKEGRLYETFFSINLTLNHKKFQDFYWRLIDRPIDYERPPVMSRIKCK